MFLRHACWAAAGLLTVLPVGSSFAQDGSAPPIPTLSVPFVDADSEAVTLVYKYRPGQTDQGRLTMKGDTTLTFLGAPGRTGATTPTQIVTSANSTMLYSTRVVGVDAGGGSVRIALTGFQSTLSAREVEVVSRLQNGKLVASRNGVRLPDNDPSQKSYRALFASYPRVQYATNRGAVSKTAKPAEASRANGKVVSNNGSGGIIPDFLLPDRPVKVGESWDAEGSFGTDMIGGSSTNGGRLQGHCTHRLLEIRKNGGKRIAVIQSEQVAESTASGASAPTVLRGHFSGVSYFDIDRGAMVRGEYLLDLFTRTHRDTGLTGSLVQFGGSLQADGRFKIIVQDTTPAASLASKTAQR